MAGDIGLVGGEEFRVGCEDMDREIMRVSGQQPSRVLVLPTAAGIPAAMEAMLLGERIPAERAYELGMINRFRWRCG